MYRELPSHIRTIFDQRLPKRVKDLNHLDIEAALKETFTVTQIITETKQADGNAVTVFYYIFIFIYVFLILSFL